MTSQRPHDRSRPGGAAGAADGAGGLAAAAQRAARANAEEAANSAASSAEPLPTEPGTEYVAKSDHDRVVVQLTDERDSMRGDLQRIAADFENYKRRSAREREQASAAAETKLLADLLGVFDDLERALQHAENGDAPDGAAADGLRTVRDRLTSVVGSHGLERIDTSGAFDANLHEALMVQPAPDGQPDDTILQELESGWKVGDRVLRHARVIVAGGG